MLQAGLQHRGSSPLSAPSSDGRPRPAGRCSAIRPRATKAAAAMASRNTTSRSASRSAHKLPESARRSPAIVRSAYRVGVHPALFKGLSLHTCLLHEPATPRPADEPTPAGPALHDPPSTGLPGARQRRPHRPSRGRGGLLALPGRRHDAPTG